MKYSVILLIISCLCTSLAETNDASSKILNLKPTKSLIYNLSVTFLKQCNLNPKKIIIFDRNFTEETFPVVAEIQPQTSVLMISDIITWKQRNRYRVNNIEIDAVILVIDVFYKYDIWYWLFQYFVEWWFKKDPIIYIFPTPLHACNFYDKLLKFIMRFYFTAAYFICLNSDQHLLVYTHDPYGNTNPPHWNKINQEFFWGKNWTFYERSYKNDMSELCDGFYFERTDPTNKTSPILGLYESQYNRTFEVPIGEVLNDEIEQYLNYYVSEQLHNLKRLVKLEFNYFTVDVPRRQLLLGDAYHKSWIDALIVLKGTVGGGTTWRHFYPVKYDSYAIMSHDRGLMTPLEKIAKFYGVWTLSSLIVVLSITFIVIWFATRNINLTIFNVIRLLINSEIIVPINTWSRKMFFSMVFLYFLIIHATFSGHLAEFLTSAEHRNNIDSIKDLKDSRIEKIYCFGYKFDESDGFYILKEKIERITKSSDCKRIKVNPKSSCIAPLSAIQSNLISMKDLNRTYYVSKNTFGLALISDVYRARFPLREKFNWAIMFMFDTRIINHMIEVEYQRQLRKIENKIAAVHVNYRNVKISDLYFAFIFLIIGNFLGFICFLLEKGFRIITNKLKNRQKNKKIISVVVESRQNL